MNSEQIRQVTLKALGEITGKEPASIEDVDKLFADLGLESIDFVELIFELEHLLETEIEINEFVVKAEVGAGIRFQEFDVGNLITQVELFLTAQ